MVSIIWNRTVEMLKIWEYLFKTVFKLHVKYITMHFIVHECKILNYNFEIFADPVKSEFYLLWFGGCVWAVPWFGI